jgi:hypothetical protein
MPRVRSCDTLYQRATDKTLPHLPQPDDEVKIVHSTEAPKSEEVVTTSTPTTDFSNNKAELKQQINDQRSHSTISAPEAAWQDHLFKDQRARKWKTSTALQIVMDQNTTLLSNIKISSAKAECLVSLLNDIAGNNQRLRYLHQRAIEQSHTLSQQSEQLASASKFIIKSNAGLIAECENFLKDHADSYHILIAAKENSFKHAMGSKTSQSNARIPKNQDIIEENETLAIFVTSLTTLLDALENINVLLLEHKQVFDSQILEFKTTMAELVQKKSSSSMSLLFKFSCFR